MQAIEVNVDRDQARELYRDYKKHQHYSTPIDHEIQRTYQLIAQGRMVIQALESIKLAGLNDEGFPKLAIARADQQSTFTRIRHDGSMQMGVEGQLDRRHHGSDKRQSSVVFTWPSGAFDSSKWRGRWSSGEALLPLVPVHLRPKRALQNYHILWEAEWTRVVPRDPFLLRRIGKGDLWLVLAQWDLTPVERAALATRVASA